MKYSELSSQQKIALSSLIVAIRPLGARFANAAREADIILKGADVLATEALSLLDDDATIPNDGGVFGAAPLSRLEVEELLSDLSVVADTFGSIRKLASYVKASGTVAIIED